MSYRSDTVPVFNLYAIEGYSHKEIAELLGINENTSKSQLSRARMQLQKKIVETEKVLETKNIGKAWKKGLINCLMINWQIIELPLPQMRGSSFIVIWQHKKQNIWTRSLAIAATLLYAGFCQLRGLQIPRRPAASDTSDLSIQKTDTKEKSELEKSDLNNSPLVFNDSQAKEATKATSEGMTFSNNIPTIMCH
jgi:hypothetical protein